jgi:threonine/homoserine/homoserine lactone efflux protein
MEWYLSVMLFAVSTSITPGPNNIMLMTSGLNFGVRRTIPHLLGILVGFPLLLVAVAAGFSALFVVFPQLHHMIQIVGVIYLLVFAWMIASSEDSGVSTSNREAMSFIQALTFQWFNPKAWIMATGAIATYTTTDSDFALQVAYIVTAFCLAATPCLSVWLLFGSFLSRYLRRTSYRKVFNVTMAGLLVVSILPIIRDLGM